MGKKLSKSDMARTLESATKYSREFSKQFSNQEV
jgi:hypothetical protein